MPVNLSLLCHIPDILLESGTVDDKHCPACSALVLVNESTSQSFVSGNIDQSSVALKRREIV